MALYLVLLSTILAFALTITEQCVSSATTRTATTTPATSTTTPNPCPHSGYQLFAEFNCYKAFSRERKTWSEARERCKRDGGDLMVMESSREREDVYIPLFNSVKWTYLYPWVGVYIPQGGDVWTSVKGEAALSTWWEPRYPKKNAARKCALAYSGGLLGNWDCADNTTFICEISL